MTSRTGSARGILGFWKSQGVELRLASGEDGWLSLARRSQASGLCGGCRTRWGVRWKSQNRKNVYLSPYVEEPLNSKVIKSFAPELRSRKCFSGFEIPVLSLWTFDVHFTHSHIMAMVHHYLGLLESGIVFSPSVMMNKTISGQVVRFGILIAH